MSAPSPPHTAPPLFQLLLDGDSGRIAVAGAATEEVGRSLVAVEVEQLSMTDDASSTTVEKCHLAMVEHRFGVFAQAEQATR